MIECSGMDENSMHSCGSMDVLRTSVSCAIAGYAILGTWINTMHPTELGCHTSITVEIMGFVKISVIR